MEIDYKIVSFIIGIILTIIWYFVYIKDVYLWKTKPHLFSWFIWGLLGFIAFLAQLSDNWWLGAWIAWLTSFSCCFVAFLSIKRWEKNITKGDKYSLVWALLSMILWYMTDNVLYSLILVILLDALWFYPTLRKSFFKPFEETLLTHLLWSIRFWLSILALNNLTLITFLYPLSLAIMNFVLAVTIYYRRKKVSEKLPKKQNNKKVVL